MVLKEQLGLEEDDQAGLATFLERRVEEMVRTANARAETPEGRDRMLPLIRLRVGKASDSMSAWPHVGCWRGGAGRPAGTSTVEDLLRAGPACCALWSNSWRWLQEPTAGAGPHGYVAPFLAEVETSMINIYESPLKPAAKAALLSHSLLP